MHVWETLYKEKTQNIYIKIYEIFNRPTMRDFKRIHFSDSKNGYITYKAFMRFKEYGPNSITKAFLRSIEELTQFLDDKAIKKKIKKKDFKDLSEAVGELRLFVEEYQPNWDQSCVDKIKKLFNEVHKTFFIKNQEMEEFRIKCLSVKGSIINYHSFMRFKEEGTRNPKNRGFIKLLDALKQVSTLLNNEKRNSSCFKTLNTKIKQLLSFIDSYNEKNPQEDLVEEDLEDNASSNQDELTISKDDKEEQNLDKSEEEIKDQNTSEGYFLRNRKRRLDEDSEKFLDSDMPKKELKKEESPLKIDNSEQKPSRRKTKPTKEKSSEKSAEKVIEQSSIEKLIEQSNDKITQEISFEYFNEQTQEFEEEFLPDLDDDLETKFFTLSSFNFFSEERALSSNLELAMKPDDYQP